MLEAPKQSQEGAQEVTSVPVTKDVPQTELATDFEVKGVGGGDILSAHKGLSNDGPISPVARSSPVIGM